MAPASLSGSRNARAVVRTSSTRRLVRPVSRRSAGQNDQDSSDLTPRQSGHGLVLCLTGQCKHGPPCLFGEDTFQRHSRHSTCRVLRQGAPARKCRPTIRGRPCPLLSACRSLISFCCLCWMTAARFGRKVSGQWCVVEDVRPAGPRRAGETSCQDVSIPQRHCPGQTAGGPRPAFVIVHGRFILPSGVQGVLGTGAWDGKRNMPSHCRAISTKCVQDGMGF